MAKTYIVIVAIAAVILGVYFALPDRHFVDSVFPLHDGASVFEYDDKGDGGSSEVTFSLTDSSLSFSCALGADTAKSAWCGLLFDLSQGEKAQYRNWTFVDSLIFELESSGTDEILVKVWTFDPDVTDITKPRTFRLLMKEIPLTKGRQRIAFPFEQFYTPDFWYDDEHVDRKLNRRHQETVARVEIAPGWNHPRVKKFSLKFYSITAKGVSNFAFGVVMFLMLGLMIVAIGRTHSYNKENESKKAEPKA